MTLRAQEWWKQWLPFFLSTVLQVVGGVAFAIHVSDQGVQNAKDITELKLLAVPRSEYEQQKAATKDSLSSIDRKLDILLERKEDTK